MDLAAGQTFSHYTLIEKIGEGGMGVVWKARDGKLDRDVAVKILPAEFSEDTQRLARFEREAKLLAALNHPNIDSIHGLEHTDGLHFLVLELIPGQSLAETLKDGPLPVEEALDVCRQIAEGLGAAHEAGVIHRDLKPGNILVTPDGKAKVLDFGLAKGLEGVASRSGSGGSASDLSQSPTVAAGTQAGVILGTAPYMSPEQARGKTLDKRTDIWSFGCLLYECLTSRTAFTGETVTDILSVILQSDPDWSVLPDRTPPRVRELLERCLEKNSRNRLHDIGDARIEIEKSLAGREWTTSEIRAASAPGTMGAVANSRRITFLLSVPLIAAAITIGVMALELWRDPSNGPSRARTSLSFVPPADLRMPPGDFGLHPEGESILFGAAERTLPESDRIYSLYERRLDRFGAERIQGSKGLTSRAFSPDGDWLAFVAPVSAGSTNRQLLKVGTRSDALPVTIADWPDIAAGGLRWLPGGDLIAVSLPPYRLFRFPSDGTSPIPAVEIRIGKWGQELLELNRPLPDDRHVLLAADLYADTGWRIDLFVIDVETGETKKLVEDAFGGIWSPTGHLLFSRRDKILAVPFDLETLEVTGGPVAILDNVLPAAWWMYGFFDLAQNGTLAYVPGGREEMHRRITLVGKDGEAEPWSDEPAFFWTLSTSPDGQRVAINILNDGRELFEIWTSEVARPRLRPLAAAPDADCQSPLWSPDGKRLAYYREGGESPGMYLQRADGSGEPELLLSPGPSEIQLAPTSFSPDGSMLLITRYFGTDTDVVLLPLDPTSGGTRDRTVLLPREFSPRWARISADGRWLAYSSEESGRREVYVRSIGPQAELGPAVLASFGGGDNPVLAPDPAGRTQKLYYRKRSHLMTVTVTPEPELAVSEPVPAFETARVWQYELSYSPLPGGRFLILQASEAEEETKQVNVILNFHEEIKRRFAEAE